MRYEFVQICIIVLCFNLPYIFNWIRVSALESNTIVEEKIVYVEKNIIKQSDITDDCIQALMSLGMKKTASKEKVDKMFSQKEYLTIEDFLMDAYKI
jgi:Holliday junction resolvasome RuvABC DNA-binding subunit